MIQVQHHCLVCFSFASRLYAMAVLGANCVPQSISHSRQIRRKPNTREAHAGTHACLIAQQRSTTQTPRLLCMLHHPLTQLRLFDIAASATHTRTIYEQSKAAPTSISQPSMEKYSPDYFLSRRYRSPPSLALMAHTQPEPSSEQDDLVPWPWNSLTQKKGRGGDREPPGDKTALSTFKHEPLPQLRRLIRLIEVLPDKSPDGLVQCRMRSVLICEESPPYTCLSYTWGRAAEEPCNVTIEEPEFERRGVFAIRQNLQDFLEASIITHLWSMGTALPRP